MENYEGFEPEAQLSWQQAMNMILERVSKTKLETEEYEALVQLLQAYTAIVLYRNQKIKKLLSLGYQAVDKLKESNTKENRN